MGVALTSFKWEQQNRNRKPREYKDDGWERFITHANYEDLGNRAVAPTRLPQTNTSEVDSEKEWLYQQAVATIKELEIQIRYGLFAEKPSLYQAGVFGMLSDALSFAERFRFSEKNDQVLLSAKKLLSQDSGNYAFFYGISRAHEIAVDVRNGNYRRFNDVISAILSRGITVGIRFEYESLPELIADELKQLRIFETAEIINRSSKRVSTKMRSLRCAMRFIKQIKIEVLAVLVKGE